MNDPMRPEVIIDLKENVLSVGFHEDSALPHDSGPALNNRYHDLVYDEGLRLHLQAFDDLHEQRGGIRILKIACIEREIRDQEPLLLVRTRNPFPDEKPPGVASIAVGKAEGVREIGERFVLYVRDVSRAFDAVINVLEPSRRLNREMRRG